MGSDRSIFIPLTPDYWATLIVRTPLTPAEWTRLLSVLEAMRPALVDEGQKLGEVRDGE